MGRLVGIELNNFKSYKGLARVGFGTSSYFTSIIGPNGSGKSNMMDAISFVLGVRSSQLRSKDLKSLIYRGVISMDDDDDDNGDADIGNEPLDDPDSAYVKAIYVKENGDTLELKREIAPNGSCTFTINGANVTVNQYSQVLKDENILIKARNFLVFQGDVEKVAAQSPTELTNMVETISGSIGYKRDFDSLKIQCDKAHDETTLKNLKKRTLKDEINLLTGKCNEINIYDAKVAKIEQLKINKYLIQLYSTEVDLDNAKKDLKTNTKAFKDLEKSIEDKTAEYKTFIEEQGNGRVSIKNFEKDIEVKEFELRDLRTKIIPIESKVAQLAKKVDGYEARIQTLTVEAEAQKETINVNNETLDDLKAAYNAFTRKFELVNEDLHPSQTTSDEMLSDYNAERQTFLLRAGYLESQIRDLKDEKDSIISQIDSVNNAKLLINSRVQQLESKKTNATLNNTEITSRLEAANTQIKNHTRELKDFDSKKIELQEVQSNLNKKLKIVLQKLTELNSARRESAREKKIREISSTLKRIFPGVKGILHDVVKPRQRKYNTALTALLGKNLDSIIVDSASTAHECIQYMKSQRLGVASFMPLDTIKVTLLDPSLRKIHEQARPAVDTLSVPAEFDKVAQFICGNSLVCDTIEIATSIKWGNAKGKDLKLVSLDGSLIHKSGLMTGGISTSMTKKWDQAEWASLNEEKEELKSQFDRLKDQVPDDYKYLTINEEIETLTTIIPSIERALGESNRELEDVNKALNHENLKLNELSTEINKLREQTSDIDKELNVLKIQSTTIENEIYESFCNKYSFVNIQEYETKYCSKFLIDTKQDMTYKKEIQKLQQKVEFETERLNDYYFRIQKLQEDKKLFEVSFNEVKKEKREINIRMDTIQAELEVVKEEYEEMKLQIRVKLSEESTLKNELVTLRSDLRYLKKQLSQFEEVVETIKLNRRNILSNSIVENVKIPLISGSLDGLSVNDENENRDEAWNNLLEELEVDYEPIEENDDIDLQDETLEDEIKKRINLLTDEIKDMNPDSRSRERLDISKIKYKEADIEFKEAKEIEQNLLIDFNKIKEKRLDTFMRAFEHIAKQINGVYQDLTRSPKDDGGSAYLTLENEEDPYLNGIKYQVKLPTKRFQEMENLSGGEKTVAALGLLFAIHSYHPSPFFVLDEVDAALDNANVGKIANYICKHKGPNFQFIIISLKNNLFEQSDTLVGIYRDQDINSSKVMTMDLRPYDS